MFWTFCILSGEKTLYIQGHCPSLAYFPSPWQTAWPKAVWERKGFIWLTSYSLSLMETQGRSLKRKPWRDSTYWHSLSGPLYHFYITQTHLSKDGIAHRELGLPTSVSSSYVPPRHSDKAIWLRPFFFFSWDFLFPDDYRQKHFVSVFAF